MSNKLYLVRGLPGSGKSTLASEYTKWGWLHFEADQYFTIDNEYWFDKKYVQKAHEWCQWKTSEALSRGHNVVVANTFTRLWEMEFYLELGYDTTVFRCVRNFKNIHNVPDEVIKTMRDRFEDYNGEVLV